MGGHQDFQCIASTVSGVDISSVAFRWMLIGGGPVTNNSRVSISPTTSNGSNFTSTLQFEYITEEDDGIYVCTVMILETDVSEFVEIEDFHGESDTHTCTYVHV